MKKVFIRDPDIVFSSVGELSSEQIGMWYTRLNRFKKVYAALYELKKDGSFNLTIDELIDKFKDDDGYDNIISFLISYQFNYHTTKGFSKYKNILLEFYTEEEVSNYVNDNIGLIKNTVDFDGKVGLIWDYILYHSDNIIDTYETVVKNVESIDARVLNRLRAIRNTGFEGERYLILDIILDIISKKKVSKHNLISYEKTINDVADSVVDRAVFKAMLNILNKVLKIYKSNTINIVDYSNISLLDYYQNNIKLFDRMILDFKYYKYEEFFKSTDITPEEKKSMVIDFFERNFTNNRMTINRFRTVYNHLTSYLDGTIKFNILEDFSDTLQGKILEIKLS